MKQTKSRASSNAAVSLSGLLTGAAAGLVGVGGGEFRMPVLVRVLEFPIKIAASMNLLIGLATVIVSLWRRWGQRAIVWEELTLASAMVVACPSTSSLPLARRAVTTLRA